VHQGRAPARRLIPDNWPETIEAAVVILQAILTAIFRSAGKILNTAFGWATTMLFGKVPEDRQIFLSVISLGSVAWLVAVIGVAFPAAATFLFSFVTLPSWVDKTWIRWAMLGAAALLPALVGFLSRYLLDPEDRPKGAGANVKAVLRGYPYTLGLALTLVLLLVFAPIRKLRDVIRRWTGTHVPVVVEGDDYFEVVSAMQRALRNGGFPCSRVPASWMVRLPTRLLTTLAGSSLNRYVAKRLTTLKSDKIEVTLHPSDLVISGRQFDAARARAVVAEHLAFSKAYLTWSKEGQQLEDRLEQAWQAVRHHGATASDILARLRQIDQDARTKDLPYEEWEVLFREILLVEREALGQQTGERVSAERDGDNGHAEQPTDSRGRILQEH
jgi:hypothetical protein